MKSLFFSQYFHVVFSFCFHLHYFCVFLYFILSPSCKLNIVTLLPRKVQTCAVCLHVKHTEL